MPADLTTSWNTLAGTVRVSSRLVWYSGYARSFLIRGDSVWASDCPLDCRGTFGKTPSKTTSLQILMITHIQTHQRNIIVLQTAPAVNLGNNCIFGWKEIGLCLIELTKMVSFGKTHVFSDYVSRSQAS